MMRKHFFPAYLFFFFYIMIVCVSCDKKHDSIHGNVTINGRITDEVSGAAIPNVIITMYSYKLTSSGLGGGTVSVIDLDRKYGVDTTDANGNYEISVEANGEYEFEADAEVNNDHYINASTNDNSQNIKSSGTYTRDLTCNRSAFAKFIITNISPLDTASFLGMSDFTGHVYLHNFYKDSTVYLKINGGLENPTQVRLENSNITNNYMNVSAARWDTVSVPFNY